MPDELPIKITRSAGSTWPTRFGPVPPGVVSVPDTNAVAQAVTAAAQSVATSSNNIAPGPLNNLSDVDILNVQTGDLLRFSNNRWRNTPEKDITDGGNF